MEEEIPSVTLQNLIVKQIQTSKIYKSLGENQKEILRHGLES
jgi:hypothetical protein